MTTARKEWELNQLFDELTQILEDTSESFKSKKEPVVTPKKIDSETKKSDITPAVYHRKSGPRVISIEEYERRVANGEFKNHTTQTKPDATIKKQTQANKTSTVIKKSNVSKVRTNVESPKKITIKKPAISKISDPKSEAKHKRKIAKMSKIIEKNIAHELRYTEPKKRNLLSRIILQERLAKGHYRDLAEDYENGYITEEEVNSSKVSSKWGERRLYKEVQAYEDAKEDVSVRKGWMTFKLSLAGVALAGAVALGAYTYNEVDKFFNEISASHKIVSIYDVKEEERLTIETRADQVKEEILMKDGYHFDNISDEEFSDGYYRMLNYEKKMDEKQLKSAMYGMLENKDQKLLDTIVEKSFGEDYANFSEEKKRDYRQLAFELLSYSHPENAYYIRNPIVMDELRVRDLLKEEKGYKIELRVNGDEEETVRNLGNIMHELHEMDESDFKSYENEQDEFFEDIMITVLGDSYQELDKKEKRDYIQIIYEWLPDNAKQYIKDPIEVEKINEQQINEQQINEMEIGE